VIAQVVGIVVNRVDLPPVPGLLHEIFIILTAQQNIFKILFVMIMVGLFFKVRGKKHEKPRLIGIIILRGTHLSLFFIMALSLGIKQKTFEVVVVPS
jgi:hypothetical protein